MTSVASFAIWILVSLALFIFNLPALIAANEESQEGQQ